MGMLRRCFVLALLALAPLGCSHDAPEPPSFWTDNPALTPLLAAAAEQWGTATGREISIAPEGIPVFFVETLDPKACGPNALGCSFGGADARIELLASAPPRFLARVVLHEMGHELRGEPGHLAHGGAVMSDPIEATAPTAADHDFVCSAFDCWR